VRARSKGINWTNTGDGGGGVGVGGGVWWFKRGGTEEDDEVNAEKALPDVERVSQRLQERARRRGPDGGDSGGSRGNVVSSFQTNTRVLAKRLFEGGGLRVRSRWGGGSSRSRWVLLFEERERPRQGVKRVRPRAQRMRMQGKTGKTIYQVPTRREAPCNVTRFE